MPIDFSQEIDVVENISISDFQEKYFKPQIPVKIKNFMHESPALKKWTIPFFKERIGHVKVGVFNDGVDILDRPNNIAVEHMKFGEYLDLISAGPTDKRLFAFNMYKADSSLKDDIVIPKYTKRVLPFVNLAFFGGAGSFTRIHRDADSSNLFLTEFVGEKKVVLFDESNDAFLYRYPFTIHSGVDIENPDYEKYPGLHYARGMHTILRKGETLFMPANYWHYVRYLTPGIGINYRVLGSVKNTLRGLNHVTLTMQFDLLMRKSFGKWWFNNKTRKAHERANKAIEMRNKKFPAKKEKAELVH